MAVPLARLYPDLTAIRRRYALLGLVPSLRRLARLHLQLPALVELTMEFE